MLLLLSHLLLLHSPLLLLHSPLLQLLSPLLLLDSPYVRDLKTLPLLDLTLLFHHPPQLCDFTTVNQFLSD